MHREKSKKKDEEDKLKLFFLTFIYVIIGTLGLYSLGISIFFIIYISGFYVVFYKILKNIIDNIENMKWSGVNSAILFLLSILFGIEITYPLMIKLFNIDVMHKFSAFMIGFYLTYIIMFLRTKYSKRVILTFNKTWWLFLVGLFLGFLVQGIKITNIFSDVQFMSFMGIFLGLNFLFPFVLNSETLQNFSYLLTKTVSQYNTHNIIVYSLYLLMLIAIIILCGEFLFNGIKRKTHYIETLLFGMSIYISAYLISKIFIFDTIQYFMFFIGYLGAISLQHFVLLTLNEKV